MPAPTTTPTHEQSTAIGLFQQGHNVTIEALAGTGKTSTLQFIAASARGRGLYVAFNKSVQLEAAEKFSGLGVSARTMHSLAYREFGAPMKERMGARTGPRAAKGIATVLGITDKYVFGADSGAAQGALAPTAIVRMVESAVNNYLRSPQRDIDASLVDIPVELGQLKELEAVRLREAIVEFARKWWADVTDPNGRLVYKPDYYLKQWQLSEPTLPYDYILFDEAQDADNLMVDVVGRQSAQVVTVGDRNQAIYGWRGAQMAMDAFNGVGTSLTRSFRFGAAIAEYANSWLGLIGSDLRLQGHEGNSSVFEAHKSLPTAVLTRSNMQAINEIVTMQERGKKTSIAGERKARELRSLAQAAWKLQETGSTSHPELSMFNTWEEVIQFADSEDGEELRPLVSVVERFGADKVVTAIDACVPMAATGRDEDTNGPITVSTAHVAKGLEFFHVRIAEDFREPNPVKGTIQPIPAEEARLAYVAATRATRHLDPRGFAWRDDYVSRGGWVAGTDAADTVHMGGEHEAHSDRKGALDEHSAA